MKMTFLALAGKWVGFGFRSYILSLASATSDAIALSSAIMALSASAPKPTAASCKACLRVRNVFMASLLQRSVTVQEIVCAHHRLKKQAQAFFRIGVFGDGLFRNLKLFRGRLP